MDNVDFVLISQSETVRYKEYSSMPIDRIDLFRNLVQLRMVYYDGGFKSHMDMFNKALYGRYFDDASYNERRHMFNIWNMPALNGFLALNPLIEAGFNCRLINNFDSEADILFQCGGKMEPPIIGISTTFILQWAEVGRITKSIRQNIPNAVIIIGGAFVNDQFLTGGEKVFEKPMAKYGIAYALFSSNSENDLLSLINVIKLKKEGPESVNNLAYFDGDNVYRTTRVVWNEPGLRGTLSYDRLMDRDMDTGTIQLRTSSGCPFRCAFCSYSVAAGGYHRSEIEDVVRQLEEIKRIKGIEAVVFIDDTLNVPEKRFRELVSALKNYDFRWYSFYRAQYADETLAKDLEESGCDGLYLGLESANDMLLKNMNKKATVDGYRRGIRILKNRGIPLFGMFVVGFPGETEGTIDDNIDFINHSGLDFYSVKEFYYLHTAPVHEMRGQFGLTGEGYRWKHSTMASTEATELKLKMFELIDNSIHIDPDLGLWYLIYLRDRGLGWTTIRSCQKIINNMLRADNAGRYDDKESLFLEFRNNLKTR